MPARSQAQQRFLAICAHDPQHARGTCPDMTRQQYHDFAATPRTGLPLRVRKPKTPTLSAALGVSRGA